MKLIKKIAAIMFAFMMVFTLSSNVNAKTVSVDSTQTGTITINNAKKDHTYKLYRILDLDSYSYDDANTNKEGNYSYSIPETAPENKWKDFITQNAGVGNYFTIAKNKYVTFNEGKSVVDLAKDAIAYANVSANGIKDQRTLTPKNDGPITFTDLKLGYYLIDSSMGTLCVLNTTNKDATVNEKNEVPTVEKKVKNQTSTNYSESIYSELDKTINFQIKIEVKKGVENYELHDKADEGITINKGSINVSVISGDTKTTLNKDTDYTVDVTPDDRCSFHIKFIKGIKEDDIVYVNYDGNLNEKAKVLTNLNVTDDSKHSNKNEAWLKYGHTNTTTHESVNIQTLSIPVFKYTDPGTGKIGLKGVEFTLSTDADGNDKLYFIKESSAVEEDVYTRVTSDTPNATTTIITPESGKFRLNGLKGDYFLKETKALPGYNKIDTAIKLHIDGIYIKINDDTKVETEVKVENNKGSLLPTTGGMGTTLIYLIGGALVLGSGFVLANKKRAKAK